MHEELWLSVSTGDVSALLDSLCDMGAFVARQRWNNLSEIKFLTWTFSFLLEKSGANIALEQKLSKSGPVFSK